MRVVTTSSDRRWVALATAWAAALSAGCVALAIRAAVSAAPIVGVAWRWRDTVLPGGDVVDGLRGRLPSWALALALPWVLSPPRRRVDGAPPVAGPEPYRAAAEPWSAHDVAATRSRLGRRAAASAACATWLALHGLSQLWVVRGGGGSARGAQLHGVAALEVAFALAMLGWHLRRARAW